MSQERADLNWYHKPPDYFAGRSGAAHDRTPAETQRAARPQEARAGEDHDTAAGDFTFDDFLDIINPLQHLPGISMVYRAVTGDEISPHARIIGGGLFGGGTGFVAAIANAISQEASGRDLGDNLIASVFGEDTTAPSVASGNTRVGEADQVAARPDPQGARVASGQGVGSAPEPKGSADAVGIGSDPVAAPAPVGAVAKTTVAQSADAGADTASPAATVDQRPGQDGLVAPLEGEAALAALFSDLRGRDRPANSSRPTPRLPSDTQALAAEPRAALQAASAPRPDPKASLVAPLGGLVFDPSLFAGGGLKGQAAKGTVEAAHPFTGQMLHGLQKYEEMMTRRQVSQADIGLRDR